MDSCGGPAGAQARLEETTRHSRADALADRLPSDQGVEAIVEPLSVNRMDYIVHSLERPAQIGRPAHGVRPSGREADGTYFRTDERYPARPPTDARRIPAPRTESGAGLPDRRPCCSSHPPCVPSAFLPPVIDGPGQRTLHQTHRSFSLLHGAQCRPVTFQAHAQTKQRRD
jgi:hypothetical protein